MRTTNKIVEGFLKEAEEDYIGLWAISGTVRWHLGLSANEEVKARTLDVIRMLLDHGLFAGDYDYGGAFHPWQEHDTNATIARIDREWDPA